MDALSEAANVISTIDISAKIASLCFRYLVTVKDAKDIDRLQRTVIDIENVLKEVEQLLHRQDKTRLSVIYGLSDSLEECYQQLQGLKAQLEPRKTGKAMHRFNVRALKWPFTNKQVEKIVASLKKYEQTFSLALQVDQTSLISSANQKLSLVDRKTDNLLKLPIAKGASFNSHIEEHNARCLSNTRVELLSQITEWAKDRNGKPIFWLNGMAGTGKSTVARTVAQSFANNGQLGASFFFKKGEGDRGNAARFFTTIAADLMARMPEMVLGIRKAIDVDPVIPLKTLKDQFEKLILQPLSEVGQAPSRDLDLVVVVDALDECEREEDIREILQLLARARDTRPVSLRIFVTSRPGLSIRLSLKHMSDGTYQDLIPHEVPVATNEHDISIFIRHELAEIRVLRNLPLDWPGEGKIQALVEMAVPFFIYAATACRFIGDTQGNPKRRLETILQYQTAHQVSKLDKTYLPILEQLSATSDESIWNQPYSDSGYGTADPTTADNGYPEKLSPLQELADEGAYEKSEDFEDSATIYSETSSLPTLAKESYITELTDNLVSTLLPKKSSVNSLDSVQLLVESLPDLLKEFALKLGHEAPSAAYLDVMAFIHRYRSNIAQAFERGCARDAEDEEIPEKDRRSGSMPLQDKMGNWFQTMNGDHGEAPEDPHNDNFNQDTEDHTIDEPSMPDKDEYRRLIVEAPAYGWLLARLRREMTLGPVPRRSVLNEIRDHIVASLPPSRMVSKKKPTEACSASFELEWDLLGFLNEQEYDGEYDQAVQVAITLTGSGKDAQALTCSDYLSQTWPTVGEYVMALLMRVVREEPGRRHLGELPDHTRLTMWMEERKVLVRACGPCCSLAEIGEQLAWLGSALRSSPYQSGIAYSIPTIRTVDSRDATVRISGISRTTGITYKMQFDILQYEEPASSGAGQCWHNMFLNPIIVKGFPILRRSESGTGLEIPLNMMAALSQTRLIDAFNEKLFVKGFSSMLVPVRQVGDIILWHLIFKQDGGRVSYLDSNTDHADVNMSTVQDARHIVGWCSEIKYLAGAAEAHYAVGKSSLPPPGAGCVLEKVSVSTGKFITAGTTVGIGVRDKPMHISRNGAIPKLEWISERFVVFWDEEDKRGWLVNGTSALLHLLRASLKYNESSKFKDAFLLKLNELKDPSPCYTPDSAINFLINKMNMQLEIYPEKEDIYEEETIKDGRSEIVTKRKRAFYRVGDRVDHLYNILEKFIDHQTEADTQNGVRLDVQFRGRLEGWDFRDLVVNRDPFYPCLSRLETSGDGWTNLIQSIHAVTLFGRGFGEIIRPKDSRSLCDQWMTLPSNRYYLAASTSDLRTIIDLYGDDTEVPLKLNANVFWDHPERAFQICPCRGVQENHLELFHVLTTARKLQKKDSLAQSSVKLSDGGAVVFGHRWQRSAKSDRAHARLQQSLRAAGRLPSGESDSGIGTSVASLTTGEEEGSSHSASAVAHQQSDEGLPSKGVSEISSPEFADSTRMETRSREYLDGIPAAALRHNTYVPVHENSGNRESGALPLSSFSFEGRNERMALSQCPSSQRGNRDSRLNKSSHGLLPTLFRRLKAAYQRLTKRTTW